MSALSVMVAMLLCSISSCPIWMSAVVGLGCGLSVSVICYVVGIATNFSHYQSARQELEDTKSAFSIERENLIHESQRLALSSASASAKNIFFKMISDFHANGTLSEDPVYWNSVLDQEIMQVMVSHGIKVVIEEDQK
jgi:hypothetical protein